MKHIFFLLIALYHAYFAGPLSAQSCTNVSCPVCFTSDLSAHQGHGTAPDGSGRRIIYVGFDSSWNNGSGGQLNSVMSTALDNAITDWNSAVDTACNVKTAYYFQRQQSSPDIKIVKNDNILSPA